MEENRNPRPIEETSKIPNITLLVLIAMVIALLFVGWQSMKDDAPQNDELVSKRPNSVAISGQDNPVIIPPPLEETGEDNVAKDVKAKTETTKEKKTEEKKTAEPKKEEKKVEIPKGESITHTVQAGETFFQALNPDVKPDGIKVGVTKLNVKIRTIHTVGPGDVLRVVAQKYGVSKQAIMDANKKTKDFAERGEKLIIPLE
ncbi:MAG: LysM peptidoglycan-binding domain-containing protein [Arcicella sp.]|nr:LysM peptidoglycan-binding domain-containing protein [Arcicella sp.]